MRRLEMMHIGPDRLRVGAWRGDHRYAYVVPLPGLTPASSTLDRVAAELAGRGYLGILTAALGPAELDPFLAGGFTPHERLHLLRHDLSGLPPVGTVPTRRAGRRRLGAVLAIDEAAFDPFWRFDRLGIDEARRATPFTRFRVHTADAGIDGYAISGRANDVAYLQRLAVRPDRQGLGIGRALVVDALHWAARRGATSMLVNTQEVNRRALGLYERAGFLLQDQGLTVLWRPLVDGHVPDRARPTIGATTTPDLGPVSGTVPATGPTP